MRWFIMENKAIQTEKYESIHKQHKNLYFTYLIKYYKTWFFVLIRIYRMLFVKYFSFILLRYIIYALVEISDY